MKILNFSIAFLVVSLFLVTAGCKGSRNQHQQFASPFSRYLNSKKVKLFQIAQMFNGTECPFEFPIHRTHCDVLSLKTYALKDKKITLEAALSTLTSIGKYSFKLDSLIQSEAE